MIFSIFLQIAAFAWYQPFSTLQRHCSSRHFLLSRRTVSQPSFFSRFNKKRILRCTSQLYSQIPKVKSTKIMYNQRFTLTKISFIFISFRLTPSYAFMILITANIFIHLGDGPLWESINGPEMERCQQYWWSGLLYVQNFVNPNSMVKKKD